MFKDKVFVVTGGANGIGKELTMQLLKSGASVACLDISENALTALQKETKEFKTKLSVHKVDVSNKQQIEELLPQVLKAHKTVDGIINNAGIIHPFVKVEELSYEQIEKNMNVNFYGPLYLIKTFLPTLKSKQTKTYICNVSSMGGFLPVPGQSIYCASKAALKMLTEGLYAELKDTNVSVNVVFPGAIATEITKNSNVEIKMEPSDKKQKSYKMLSAPKAAKIILAGIKKEKFRTIVGKDSGFMDKIYRISPRRAVNFISKQMKDLLQK